MQWQAWTDWFRLEYEIGIAWTICVASTPGSTRSTALATLLQDVINGGKNDAKAHRGRRQSEGSKPMQMVGKDERAEASRKDEGPKESKGRGARGRSRSCGKKNERSSADEEVRAQRKESESGITVTLNGNADKEGRKRSSDCAIIMRKA